MLGYRPLRGPDDIRNLADSTSYVFTLRRTAEMIREMGDRESVWVISRSFESASDTGLLIACVTMWAIASKSTLRDLTVNNSLPAAETYNIIDGSDLKGAPRRLGVSRVLELSGGKASKSFCCPISHRCSTIFGILDLGVCGFNIVHQWRMMIIGIR